MLFSYYRRPLFLLLLAYAGAIFLFKDFFLRNEGGLPFAAPRAGVLVEGRVLEYPVPAPGGWRFALETGKIYAASHKAGLMVYARSLRGASYGDTVAFLADIEVPPGASSPGGLDWAEYLARRGIAAQARAGEVEVVRPAGALLRLARSFRTAALETFEAALPREEASVLGGVVLGEKKSVPPDLKTAFQDSGAMHLLVASGSNVGFVVAVLYFLCSRLGLKRKYSGLAALAAAGFYVLAAGFDAPLVRAYLMFSAGLTAYLLRREAGAFHALTLAGLAILLASPRALFDAGFQMSFLAAYGLTVGMSVWGRFFRAGGLPGRAMGLFMVSFFAQLGLYPLLIVYFHKVSLVSLFSNMVLVPASGVAMALGFLLTLLSKAGFVFKGLALAAGVFMKGFLGAVRSFAGLPFAAVYVAEPSGWFIAGFFVLAFVLLHAPLLGFKDRRLYAAALAGLLLMAAGPLRQVSAGGPRKYRALLFGDHGTACVLLRTPSGALFLVNPGLAGKKLSAAVFEEGSRALEGILLTSLEEKNFGGLGDLAGMADVKTVLIPYGPAPGGFGALLEGLEKKGTKVVRVWPGEKPAAAGLEIYADWGGSGGRGYGGRGDVLDWDLGPLHIGDEGRTAARNCAARDCPAVSAGAGRIASLEFE